ncbi:MAG: hypothetical protein RIS29_1869, partial [Bacteroidota bacterium]
LWEQGVVGSNPATPTEKRFIDHSVNLFSFSKNIALKCLSEKNTISLELYKYFSGTYN